MPHRHEDEELLKQLDRRAAAGDDLSKWVARRFREIRAQLEAVQELLNSGVRRRHKQD